MSANLLSIDVFPNSKLRLVADLMTDDEFYDFCQQHRSLKIERNADKTIKIMEPTGNESGYVENEVTGELRNWTKAEQTGISFSSSTGFTLPTGAVRAPDASWLPLEKWLALPASDRKKFTHICPEFIAEVRSEEDSLLELKRKMVEWIENGVRLGWLLDPKNETTYIYRADGSVDIVRGFNKKLSGEDVLKGFELDLKMLIPPQ